MTDLCLKPIRSVTLQLRVPCDLNAVRPGTLAVRDFLAESNVPEAEICSCEIALAEACNNAIQYALPEAKDQSVEIEVICGSESIELRVSDSTAGFDWPENPALVSPESESGRGIFIIHSLIESVSYFRGTGRNCLVMRKARCSSGSFPDESSLVTPEESTRRLVEGEQIIQDMADELSFCYESLSAIFRCGAELGRESKLKDFSQRLLLDLSRITSADWFVFRLMEADGAGLSICTASDVSFELRQKFIPGELGNSVEVEAALKKHDIWFDQQRPLEPEDPLTAVKPGSVGIVHPVCLGDQLFGTITVGRSNRPSQFTAVHANVVHTFADFLAVQIANVHFQEQQVASRIVTRELEIAHEIQTSLLPKELPQFPGYGVAAFCKNARRVGGDFYDVIRFNETSSLLLIADVMGKGIPAAIFASIFRSLVRAIPEWTDQPAALLSRLNRLLYEELSGVGMFITAQLVFVDTVAERMILASAGHCPLLLVEGNGLVRAIAPEGLPIGIEPNTTFATQIEKLNQNCRLLLYTDGLTETRNAQGEFFGQDRLAKWFRKSTRVHCRAEDLKEDLAAELLRFRGAAVPSDDQTFLILAE